MGEGAGYLCSALMGTISHAGMSRQGELVNAHRVTGSKTTTKSVLMEVKVSAPAVP